MVEGSQRIVKITPDVYAFMLNYCRRGFTDVYADLRFVLSAGTHCPGIIIPLRHSRREQPKFWISFEPSWKILPPPPSLLPLPSFESTIFSVRAPLQAKFLRRFFHSRMRNCLERWNKMDNFFFFFFGAYYVVIFFILYFYTLCDVC